MPPPRPGPARLLAASVLLGLLTFLALSLAPRQAQAYPWMIRHEYSGCSVCHGDPTGGGVLTAYGRAQGDMLMSSHYGKDEAAEPSKFSGFLFGAWDPPEWMLAGGDFRMMLLVNKVGASGGAAAPPADIRPIQMQSDLRLMLRPSIFRLGGSIGYVHDGALAAKITTRDKDNLVSREHWAGIALKDDTLLIRAGRMNLPFGIRNIDHTLWVRKATRTDINTGQQHGVSVSYTGDAFRADAGAAQLMGRRQPMINALARLGGMHPGELPKSVAAMGIAGGIGKLFSTHPPIEERIAALQAKQG